MSLSTQNSRSILSLSSLHVSCSSRNYHSTCRSFINHYYQRPRPASTMLASPSIRSRRHSRSLYTSHIDAKSEASVIASNIATHEVLSHLRSLARELLPASDTLCPPSKAPQYHQYSNAQRRSFSDGISSSYRARDDESRSALNAHLTCSGSRDGKALRQQLPRKNRNGSCSTSSFTNDVASDSKSSCVRVPHDSPLVTDKQLPHETNPVQSFPSQDKAPFQREWERLWYSGVTSAFSKIAHQFPEFQGSTSLNAPRLNIAEPTLAISSLKKEHRLIFEKEEQSSTRSLSAPIPESDRLQRLHRAQRATTDIQRQAILVGLPTFEEYVEKKQKSEKQAQSDHLQPSRRQLKREARFAEKKDKRKQSNQIDLRPTVRQAGVLIHTPLIFSHSVMTHERKSSKESTPLVPATHRPLVVGLTKPQSRSASTMASSTDAAALNKEIEENIQENTKEAAPSSDNPTAPSTQKPKKEKAPKQPKPQKAAAPVAPTSPALIDLRVGHILRAIKHPNADSLYVSTIAMGDPEGTEHTQVDEETGKVVRTVCSGLAGLVPLEEMQDRKIVVVANLKPVNMRSIKSAAMVLAASPKQPEGADPHAADRVVELVTPPAGSEAGDPVHFEGWSYGEGKGPEKVLNPKKKQWEAIQPGFYTSDDLTVGFDAGVCEEVEGSEKGQLVVEGKGSCTVKTLKGAVVR